MNQNTRILSYEDKKTFERKTKDINIDTSCYEDIIYNKRNTAIKLFNEFDREVLSISDDIKRNYLKDNVAYKLDYKIVEISVNQSDLLVSFYKEAKKLDTENKLFSRKGYENNRLCYSGRICDMNDLNYFTDLCRKLYNDLTKLKNDIPQKLFDELLYEITKVGENISNSKTNKGTVFKNKRNFALISKKGYGVYIRLLNVEDDNNVLNVVGRTTYEPLCKSFKVLKKEDIIAVLPYIIKSYELTKYNPVDLKNDFIKYYYSK